MKTDLVFKTHMSKLRRRIIWNWIEKVLLTTILLALILVTIAFGLHKLGVFEWEGHGIYPLLLSISFALSLLRAFHRRKSFLDALIDIDIRLGLKDRLSTAHEYHQLDRTSLFRDLLTSEANSFLESLRSKQIVPRHFSGVHLLIPTFSMMLILLLVFDFSPRALKEEPAGTERLKRIGLDMERYAKRVRPEPSEAAKESQKKLSEQMEAVARALQDQSMTEKKLLKSLCGFMNKSENEKRRLTNKLNEELSLGDVSKTPGLESLQMEETTSAEITQLKKELRELFDGEVPASILKDLSNLALHQEMTEFFDETMEALGAPLKEERLHDGEKGFLAGRASEDSLITGDVLSEKDEAGSGSIARPKKRRKSDFEESDGRRTGDMESLFTAGQEKAKGDKKAPFDLESPKTPALKDKGVSGRGDRYNTYVRYLPAIGRAGLKEEEIIRAYQSELENVMRKEDIPLRYREYVRQYFLSIGLGKETEGNGDKQ